jgi:small ligand-binding sensory domain FIST
MRKLFVLGIAVVAAFSVAGVASADHLAQRVFVAPMDAFQEVPLCAAASNSTRGVAIFWVSDQASGTVRYKVVGVNLPGTIVAAHIHPGVRGQANAPIQPLQLTGAERGIIVEGSFVNPTLLAQMQANPEAFYVNVHTNVCPAGALRGQLG